MKRRISAGLSILLVLMLFSGCQSSSISVPKLIADRESSEKTVKVEYRDIYDMSSENAWINGARECVVAQTDGVVTELRKMVGDRVKKGEVILTTMSEELDSQYEELKGQISDARQNHNGQLRVYQLERKKKAAELSHLQSKDGKTASGEADAKEQGRLIRLCKAQIVEIDHNIAYENRVYQTKQRVLLEQLSTMERKRGQNLLKSPCNGIVGQFLNGVTDGSSVTAKQAVVVIYNTDCKVLNFGVFDYEYDMEDGTGVSEKKQAQEVVFRYLDKEYSLKEYQYTKEQKRAAVSMEASLPQCYTFDGIEKLDVGVMGKLLFKTNIKEHALCVPKDAVKTEGQKKYVYTNHNGKSEKTYVEIGMKTSQYTEIKSGLAENDEVTYTAYEGMTANETLNLDRFDEQNPEARPKVSEATVEIADLYHQEEMYYEEDGDTYLFQPYRKYGVVDEYDDGIFEELLVSEGDKVKKGQAIARVRHQVKQSELIGVQNEIQASKRQLASEKSSYDKQVKDLRKQLLDAKNSYERSLINYDLEILKTQYSLTVQGLNQGIRGLGEELTKLKEKSAGVVVAPVSGTVTECGVFSKGRSISQTDCLCKIIGNGYDLLEIESFGSFHVNQKVHITMEDGTKLTGTVVFDGTDAYRGASVEKEEVSQNAYKVYIKADKRVDYKLKVSKVKLRVLQLTNVLSIDSNAIDISINDNDYLNSYANKKVGENDYIKIPVMSCVAYGGDGKEWIIEGLSEGDVVGYLDYSDVDWEAVQ